jgi:hypothetical protein
LHHLFTTLLADHVRNGLVNYRALRADKRLEHYCAQLAATDPDTIASEKARLAFWINAYNAYTLKIICENYPVKSINELHGGGLIMGTILNTTVWDKELVTINQKKTTLNTIEHKIIRPIFHDPRIHFALVCAAKSCPPLRAEAYEGDILDQQLDDQGKTFLNNPSWNAFDPIRQEAFLSRIFNWYAEDFGGKDERVLLFIARFLPKELANTIKVDPKAWKIHYNEYDWALNDL